MEDRDIECSVVSGSNEEALFGCLDSLHKTLKGTRYLWSVTVTCIDPGTGLAGRVRARYPDATIIQSDAASGLAAHHNRVLRSSHARFLWLFDNDLLILPGAIQTVTEFMDAPGSARVGVASPKLLNPDGSLQPSTFRFPSMRQVLLSHSGIDVAVPSDRVQNLEEVHRWPKEKLTQSRDHSRTVEVDTLRAACVAIRTKAVRQVGPMAEVAIVDTDETEWHRRFKEQGWKIAYVTEASVIHYGSPTLRGDSRNLNPEYLKGALYFFKTGRSVVTYGLFCAALLATVGVRLGLEWVTRDRSGLNNAMRYADIAWSGLLRK